MSRCNNCGGSGKYYFRGKMRMVKCKQCDGTGKTEDWKNDFSKLITKRKKNE